MGYKKVLTVFRLIRFFFVSTACGKTHFPMDKNILSIALPAIVSNIVVPLLGLMDLTIAGHLGSTSFIGAIAVGTMMFNLIYWNFGFLRMGTSGITAQAVGAEDKPAMAGTLRNALLLAFLLGITIIALQYPIRQTLLAAIAPEADIVPPVREYFGICIWGAPAMLATMGFGGWFIGMQNSTYPMLVSIAINAVNVAVSLLCVYSAGMGFAGIAVGTLVSQWTGFLLSAALFFRIKKKGQLPDFRDCKSRGLNLRKFFRVNGDIFMRSLCIMLVSLFFTAAGARIGSLTLAVNAIIMQLYMLFSYFMDGFAFAGEALVGKYEGAGDLQNLRKCIRRLFLWGTAVMTAFATAYGVFGENIMQLLTDDTAVLAHAESYRIWAAIVPAAGMAAFVWDGIFVGLTATRQMLVSLAVATILFFAADFGLTGICTPNTRLWTAFVSYLIARGLILTLAYRRLHKSAASAGHRKNAAGKRP